MRASKSFSDDDRSQLCFFVVVVVAASLYYLYIYRYYYRFKLGRLDRCLNYAHSALTAQTPRQTHVSYLTIIIVRPKIETRKRQISHADLPERPSLITLNPKTAVDNIVAGACTARRLSCTSSYTFLYILFSLGHNIISRIVSSWRFSRRSV